MNNDTVFHLLDAQKFKAKFEECKGKMKLNGKITFKFRHNIFKQVKIVNIQLE